MKLHTTSAILVLAMATPALTNAGILADLSNMFMSNSTSATTIHTKDRVGMMGGSLYLRAPVKSVTIVAYDFPRLNAGCGGVYLFGGEAIDGAPVDFSRL